MPRRQGGSLSGFTPLSTPNAPTDLSVSTSIGSATVSFTAPSDTGDAAVTSYIVTAANESTGVSTGATGTESPITISPGGGTFKIRAQAVNDWGPGRLTEFVTGNVVYSGAELYTWGSSQFGQLGDATVVSKSSPIQVGSLTDWSQVASGGNRSSSIKTDGTLWSWGWGTYGALGLGSSASFSSPVQVGALADWYSIDCGTFHSASVKTDGTLWTWGANGQGQLGNNSGSPGASVNSPIQIGALTNWSQTSGGNGFTAAVKTDGTMWTWGQNLGGQLGDGTTINRSSPIQVGALTNWAHVGTGFEHTIAVKTDGSLWAWGDNSPYGELGDNTVLDKSSPIQIGSLTDWSKVDCGESHTIAVKTDGTIWTWGRNNNYGQLGDGTRISRSSPVQVGALTTWSKVSAGRNSTMAIKADGALWIWGFNNNGQLGTGNVISRSSPVQVGALTNWYQASAGSYHTATVVVVP